VLLFGNRRIAATKARRGPLGARHHPAQPAARRGRRARRPPRRHRGHEAARTAPCLALSGLSIDGAQPPGSTFKIVTLSAALQNKIARPSSSYPVPPVRGAVGRQAAQRQRRVVRRLARAGVHGLLQLGVRPARRSLGRKKMLAAAERFGFNAPPRVPGAVTSKFPKDLKDDLAVGAASIGQERDLATPLQMAAVGATIANRGVHRSPRIVRNDKVIRRRAVSRRTAGEVRDMMLSVVRAGTGTAAALPGVEVAGKTGTAELRPTASGRRTRRTPTPGSSPSRPRARRRSWSR
jgi:cell division protein FtsI/penicillin-binding protein 2